jgi:hypothetical protein
MSGKKSKRLDPVLKGMREGALKKGIDIAVSPITKPVIEAINAKLKEAHPNLDLAAPLIAGGVQCSVILGMAEFAELARPFVEERTSFDPKRVDLASELMRKYAGEKMGAEMVDLAFSFLPLIMSAFKEISISDMQALVEDDELSKHSLVEDESDDDVIIPILEEESETEVLEECIPAPKPKKRGRRKKVPVTVEA